MRKRERGSGGTDPRFLFHPWESIYKIPGFFPKLTDQSFFLISSTSTVRSTPPISILLAEHW